MNIQKKMTGNDLQANNQFMLPNVVVVKNKPKKKRNKLKGAEAIQSVESIQTMPLQNVMIMKVTQHTHREAESLMSLLH